MARLALRELCGYRAGDKGDIANVAIFADDDETYALIVAEVSAERVKAHFGSMVKGRVDRYRADNVRALNFVMQGALGGGGPRTLRADNLGKTLGGALVRLEIDVPDSFAGRRRPRPDVGWADAILDALRTDRPVGCDSVGAVPLTPGSAARTIAARFPGDAYVGFHADRFAFALEVIARRCPHPQSSLDVGPGPFTTLLAEQTKSPVDTLGFPPDGPSSGGGRHIHFDINDLGTTAPRPDIGPYDLVVFSEVLEHLYTAPQIVLSWLHDLLSPSGVLLVQTPNAAAFGRRVRLLLGRNPYDLINPDSRNPRHFREYTARELTDLAAEAELEPLELVMGSYFDHTYESNQRTANRAKLVGVAQNALYRALPGSMRTGMTAVMRRAT